MGGGLSDDVSVGDADGLAEADALGEADPLGDVVGLGDMDGDVEGAGQPDPRAAHVLYVPLAVTVMKMDWTWETEPVAPTWL